GITMRFVRPANFVTVRLLYGPQAVWRFTPQVHLAIHRTVRQTLAYTAPVSRILMEQTKRGEKAVTRASLTSKSVYRDPSAVATGAQPDAMVIPGTVSTHLVLPLQRSLPSDRILQLQTSKTGFLQSRGAQGTKSLQQQLLQPTMQQTVTETIAQV